MFSKGLIPTFVLASAFALVHAAPLALNRRQAMFESTSALIMTTISSYPVLSVELAQPDDIVEASTILDDSVVTASAIFDGPVVTASAIFDAPVVTASTIVDAPAVTATPVGRPRRVRCQEM